MSVGEVAAAESVAVERLDLPPVRVAVLAVVVVNERHRDAVGVVVPCLEFDARDIGLPEVEVGGAGGRSVVRPAVGGGRHCVGPRVVSRSLAASGVVGAPGESVRHGRGSDRQESPAADHHRSPPSTFAAVSTGSHVVLNGGAYARS